MKKTKIAIGVVIALGVVWTGTAWYTGKQLEQNMGQVIQDANARINEIVPEGRLHLSYQDYQRGVFSSRLRAVLQSSSQTEDNSLIKPGQSIVLEEKIDHGPFPFAQLKKFNLIPAMASVHSQLENTDAVKKLFEITKERSIAQIETRVGYDGGTRSDITLLPIDYNNPQTSERFASSGGTINIRADSQGNKVDFSGKLDSVTLTLKNQFDIPVVFTGNGLDIKADTRLSPEGVRIGEQSITLRNLAATVSDIRAFDMQGINGSSSFNAQNSLISGMINYSVNSLNVQDQNFGQGKLVLKLAKFDANAMKAFSENYNRQTQALMTDPTLRNDPILYQQRASQVFSANLPLLLKGNPHVDIAPLSWKNARGESSLNLAVQFKDPATGPARPQNTTEAVNKFLKTLDGKLSVSMDMATELMTHVALAEGHQKDEAAKLADQQVKGIAAMGQMFRLATQKDNNITTTLQYADDQVTMNSEKMTPDQFFARYMLGGVTPGQAPAPAPAPAQ